jgi:predicted nucleic acid-binding protein
MLSSSEATSRLNALLIGATALAHDLILVTHNTRDFEGIPKLRLDGWLKS